MAKLIERQGMPQKPLFVDYGQRTGRLEWKACQEVLALAGLPAPIRVDINGFGQFVGSGLTDPSRDFRTEAFVPGRNLVLLTLAGAIAFGSKSDSLAIGLLSESASSFPDQTEQFIVNANFALNSALGIDIKILTPLSSFSKADVIRIASDLKLPIGKTYSCHSGEDTYCGQCLACKDILATGKANLFPQFHGRRA